MKIKSLSFIALVILLSSCATVSPYDRQYINDPEMEFNSDSGKIFTNYIYSIREGATPAVSKKSSGGCGCN